MSFDLAAVTAVGHLPDVPPPEKLSDDIDRVLWVLLAADQSERGTTLSAHEISVILRDGFRLDVPRQRIQALLDGNRDLALRRRIGGRLAYQILDRGASKLRNTRGDVLFIEPDKALSRVRDVQEMFGASAGQVKICDPYLAPRSLDFLARMTSCSSIRFLTDKVHEEAVVVRDLKALRLQLDVPVEIRRVNERVLHDRYLLDDAGMLIIGSSLNGLGQRQSMIVRVGSDLRSAAEAGFDTLWSGAQTLV